MKILVVGAGTLGSEIVRILHNEHDVMVADDDIVEEEKGVYRKEEMGKKKVAVLSDVFGIKGIPEKLTEKNLRKFSDAGLIIDATDSVLAKRLVDRIHRETGIPVIIAGMDSRSLLVAVPGKNKSYESLIGGKIPRACSGLDPDAASEFAEDIKKILDEFLKTRKTGSVYYKNRGENLRKAEIK